MSSAAADGPHRPGGHLEPGQEGGTAAALPALAAFTGAEFFGAGSATSADGTDGIHLTEQNNLALGEAIAGRAGNLLS